MEQTNKEQMLEDILKELSAQGELVDGLSDALMHIAREGYFDETGQWQQPKWKQTILFNIAQARALIQKIYFHSLDYCDHDRYTEVRSIAAQEQVDNLYNSEDKDLEYEKIKKELITYLSNELNNVKQVTPRTNQFEEWISWLKFLSPKNSRKQSQKAVDLANNLFILQEDYTETSKTYRILKEAIDHIYYTDDTKYYWKPSEDQIKALSITIRSGIQLGTWEEKALTELYKQLKDLYNIKKLDFNDEDLRRADHQ